MRYFVFVVVMTVNGFMLILQMLMLARMMLSWFMQDADGPAVNFVVETTEVFIGPVRMFFDKMKWFEGSMIDMSFITTIMILMIVNLMLPTVRI
ncbi:MAG: YggT family protein [Oscillospiraceae bacterium]|nr:YggT family protein [Oscillospiraceae bacterium]